MDIKQLNEFKEAKKQADRIGMTDPDMRDFILYNSGFLAGRNEMLKIMTSDVPNHIQ